VKIKNKTVLYGLLLLGAAVTGAAAIWYFKRDPDPLSLPGQGTHGTALPASGVSRDGDPSGVYTSADGSIVTSDPTVTTEPLIAPPNQWGR
jgi:hypothetical protein